MEEIVKLGLTPQQTAEIKKQIGFELREIFLSKRSLNKLRVFRLRLNEDQQQVLEDRWGQKVRELTVTRSVATRILCRRRTLTFSFSLSRERSVAVCASHERKEVTLDEKILYNDVGNGVCGSSCPCRL